MERAGNKGGLHFSYSWTNPYWYVFCERLRESEGITIHEERLLKLQYDHDFAQIKMKIPQGVNRELITN